GPTAAPAQGASRPRLATQEGREERAGPRPRPPALVWRPLQGPVGGLSGPVGRWFPPGRSRVAGLRWRPLSPADDFRAGRRSGDSLADDDGQPQPPLGPRPTGAAARAFRASARGLQDYSDRPPRLNRGVTKRL